MSRLIISEAKAHSNPSDVNSYTSKDLCMTLLVDWVGLHSVTTEYKQFNINSIFKQTAVQMCRANLWRLAQRLLRYRQRLDISGWLLIHAALRQCHLHYLIQLKYNLLIKLRLLTIRLNSQFSQRNVDYETDLWNGQAIRCIFLFDFRLFILDHRLVVVVIIWTLTIIIKISNIILL